MAATATEYLPPALTFLIANFSSFVTEKLDSTNYFAWKTQVENALVANSLFEYAKGTVRAPPLEVTDATGNRNPNPEYKKWETVDRMLLSCLIATVSSQLLPHLVGSKNTSEVWSRLEEKFSSLSRTHIHDLKCRIYNLRKTTTMEQYIDSIKVLIQKLEATGSHMDDEELVFHTLKGLPNEQYRSFKQAIRTRFEASPLTFHGLASMLLAEDLYLDSDPVETTTILLTQHSGATASGPRVMSSATSSTTPQFQYPMVQSQPVYSGNNYGGNRNTRNGQRFNNRSGNRNNISQGYSFPPGACQICGRTNHQASTCYYRQNLEYRPPQYGVQSQSHFGAYPGSQFRSTGVPQGYGPPGVQQTYGPSQPQGHNYQQGSSQPQALLVASDYQTPSPYHSQGCYQLPFAPHLGSSPMSAQAPVQGYGIYGPPHVSSQTYGSSGSSGILPATAAPSIHTINPSPWYFDSGASAHVTSNQDHIQVPTNQGPSAVSVGNGQSVPVSNSDSLESSASFISLSTSNAGTDMFGVSKTSISLAMLSPMRNGVSMTRPCLLPLT